MASPISPPEEIERNATWAAMIAHVISQYKAGLGQ
jgi:hypothetical protein